MQEVFIDVECYQSYEFANYYKCPNCKDEKIQAEFLFCPNCAASISFIERRPMSPEAKESILNMQEWIQKQKDMFKK